MTTFADPLELTTIASSPKATTPDKLQVLPAKTISAETRPSFDVITTRAGFDALEAEWTDLYERAGDGCTIFQSFNWHWHWCNHFLPAGGAQNGKPAKLRLSIVAVRHHNRLVMIWPLALHRTAGLKQLVWIGDPVSQYGDVLAEAGAETGALLHQAWDYIARYCGADLIHLRKVRADAVVAPLLQANGATLLETQEAVSHDLGKEDDFESYSKRHKPRALRNRRRQLRRMEEKGEVNFEVHAPGADARAITLDAIAMKRVWLAQKGQVSRAYSDHRFDAFFAALAQGDDHPCGCCVSVLSCGDKTAAVEIGLNGNHTRFMHIIVYNLEFERFGAGAQHMMGSIKDSFARGLKTFDLLAPNTRYKTDWADDITLVRDYATGTSMIGRAFAWGYLKHLRPAAKAATGHIPAPLRRLYLPHARSVRSGGAPNCRRARLRAERTRR